jgi:signal transduction histidine kinase
MFSVRLTDLYRTASFRMATLFLGLFGLISAILFGFLYLQISAYALARVDDWLQRESNSLIRAGTANIQTRIDNHTRANPEYIRIFSMFDAQGRRLAGNYVGDRPAIPYFDRPFAFQAPGVIRPVSMRGIAHRLSSGEIFLVAQNLHDLEEFDEVLLHALLSAGILAFVLGLAGAVVIGTSSVRRLDAITSAIQNIVSGDLSQRLPGRGRRGNEDDLDRLVGVVNGMLDDIERLMQEVKGVCDGVAHDLRTPLARLLAGLERALRRAGSTAEYEQAIEDAIRETMSILKTFNAMLRISEIEDGARRAGFSALDLAAIAGDVIEFYQPTAEEKEIAIHHVRNGADAFLMRGDPSLLFEALANLLDNAVKFTPRNGRITVQLFDEPDVLGIAISDTGPGIPAIEQEAVFRRFHRGESSRHMPGNGLGLSLVAAVARMHGMSLAIDNAGPGCRISLRVARIR